ncbi:MAG: sulfite exporter TauE/SafE family protein [Syntrophothermus sp.]
MELWSAFLIGMAGSLHCAGMCGPLLIALPVNAKSILGFYAGRIIYNAGRIFSYILMGLLFAGFGSAASLLGFQKNISVLLGIVVIFLVITPRRYINKMIKIPAYGYYNRNLQAWMGKLLKKQSPLTLFALGMLNGLLPCGLVYVALLGAVTSSELTKGMIYMGLFGLGTLPLMFTASLMGQYINIGLRRKLSRIVPLLALLLGVAFVLRGLDLGIPYVSPKLSMTAKAHQMNDLHIKSTRTKPPLNSQQVDDCCK